MSRVIGILTALLVLLLLMPAARADVPAAAGPAGRPQPPVILVFGDSLSAGYGIRLEQGWVSLLAHKIEGAGYEFRVVNASVSGETTAGGLARLPRALDVQRPRILILELGGNDGLRGLPLASTHDNLERMMRLARARGVAVLLLGLRMPPNYGERYTAEFEHMYAQLAQGEHVAWVPFLLDHVAQERALMQADGIHPNEQGQPLLLANVWPKLEPMLHAGATAH